MRIDEAPLSSDEFRLKTEWLHGKPLSTVSLEKNGSLFLQFGNLSRARPGGMSFGALLGDAAVLMEWTWRAQDQRQVLFGSESSDREIRKGIAGLRGRTIMDLSFTGQPPELMVELSGGITIHSFWAFKGNPHWVIMTHEYGWIWVADGQVVHALERQQGRAPRSSAQHRIRLAHAGE